MQWNKESKLFSVRRYFFKFISENTFPLEQSLIDMYHLFTLNRLNILGIFKTFVGKGDNFCDCLVASLATESFFEKKSTLKGKNLLPLGANSFRLE